MGPRERHLRSEQLQRQAAELRTLAEELALTISQSAGRIALLHDDIARVHDDIATNPHSHHAAQAQQIADRARHFAAHERTEQLRWASDPFGLDISPEPDP